MSTKKGSTSSEILSILIYNRQSEAFLSENYEFTKENAHYLNKPIFTVKSARGIMEELSYRKINDWDSKKLISGTREENSKNWRRFSLVDLIIFYIIIDLRRFGFSTKRIDIILDKIVSSKIKLLNTKELNKTAKMVEVDFKQLEYYIFACLDGNKILMMIYEDEKVFISNEKDVMECYFLLGSDLPCLLLPFFAYVKKIWEALRFKEIGIKDGTTLEAFLKLNLTEKERRILEIIRNKKYEEISITSSSGENIIVRAKERMRGSFSDDDVVEKINTKDYQNVTISTVGGEKVSIVREETIKI